jgi:hypothetical protein
LIAPVVVVDDRCQWAKPRERKSKARMRDCHMSRLEGE